MNIPVDYKANGISKSLNFKITRIIFAKHLAFAGQGFSPNLKKLKRLISMFYHYSSYIRRDSFYKHRFSEPPLELSDPTEKGQFSNLAGKAIADYLSKKIGNSLLTVNYEAALRKLNQPLKGQRPDLIAFSPNSRFSIESKGRSSSSPGNMSLHKRQAKSGKIKTNYSVACVSYNIYKTVKCNYHDPDNKEILDDDNLLAQLSKQYYSGLADFLDEKYFEYSKLNIQGEQFYKIRIKIKKIPEFSLDDYFLRRPWLYEKFDFLLPRLLITTRISEFSETGVTNELNPFIFHTDIENENKIYIDNDRVGLIWEV